MSSFTVWRCDGPKCGREVRGKFPQAWRQLGPTWPLADRADFCSRQCLREYISTQRLTPVFPDQPEEDW